jgi:sugar phosphate isomerase/epimerase
MTLPLLPGLVSVSFRKHSPVDILSAAARAGLLALEWGGDVHCPHGDTSTAASLARATRDAGLTVAAYGSYYRLGVPVGFQHWGQPNPDFRAVLDSAVALGAPVVRVWAGVSGSADTSQSGYTAVADDLRRVCDLAAEAGVRVGLEYHGGTLTDTLTSTLRLSSDCPDTLLYWQPSQAESPEARLASLTAVASRLAHLHVFHWRLDDTGKTHRRPLAEGTDAWTSYLMTARTAPPLQTGIARHPATPVPRCAMLEFVPDDDIAALPTEAAALRHLLSPPTPA